MKQYKDEVVQFLGGANEYVGQLETLSVESCGGKWYRIHEPCLIFQQDNPALKRRQNILAYMCGAPKNYHNYVDIFIPRDSIIEIRTLDKKGDMFKIYRQEVDRKAPSLVVVPNMGVVAGPN